MSEKLSMDDLVMHTVQASVSVTKKDQSWVGEKLTSPIYLPADAPDAYVLYRKSKEVARMRKLMWDNMYYFAGGITLDKYMEGIEQVENALKALESKYNYKSKALILVDKETSELLHLKLFNDEVMLDNYLKTNLGFSTSDIALGTLPSRYQGTRVVDQEWYVDSSVVDNFSTTPTKLEPYLNNSLTEVDNNE